MPWNPNPQEEASLRNQIKQKWGNTFHQKSIDTAVDCLKEASGKKQTEAVLAAIITFNDLKLLAQVQYAGVTNNAPQTIRAALAQAPLLAQQAAIQAQAIQQDNQRINGYLQTVSNNDFKSHRNGTFTKQLPIQDTVGNTLTPIARHYNNGEQKLPPGGNYIEWYPLVGGTRSPQKRFFTRRSDQNDLCTPRGERMGEAYGGTGALRAAIGSDISGS
jgi:hypothetical protein